MVCAVTRKHRASRADRLFVETRRNVKVETVNPSLFHPSARSEIEKNVFLEDLYATNRLHMSRVTYISDLIRQYSQTECNVKI